MSTVVIVRKGDVGVIAADTVSKAGSIKVKRTYRKNHDKIFQFRDAYIATVGAVAHMDVLADALNRYADQVSLSDRESIFRAYVKLHPILKDEYFINAASDKDDEYETSQIDALILNPNGIFGMYSWRTIIEYERFYALGSGREYALGAMQAVYEERSAEEIAIAGVTAGCEFDDSSELPYTLYAVKFSATVSPNGRAVSTHA